MDSKAVSIGTTPIWCALALAAVLLLPIALRAAESATDPLLLEFESEKDEHPSSFPDPLETVNRGTLRFNQTLDHWILDPVTRVYRFIIPDPCKRAMRHFFVNLNTPVVLVNDLLQREWHDAGTTAARFVINTAMGFVGTLDTASAMGINGHDTDFGQTLALAGVGSGPYLVLPVFGPTTVRDGFGNLVGVLFRPTTYLTGGSDELIFYSLIYGGSSGLVTLEENVDNLRRLESGSVDFYAALRSAYYQVRTAAIAERSKQHMVATQSPDGCSSRDAREPDDPTAADPAQARGD